MTFWRPKTLAPTVSNLILDWVERSVVLIIFAYFVVRMAPRLAQLITVQMDHPELILPAAGISAQAALLIVSELLSVILILARRPSPSLSSYPFDWALCFLAITLPLLVVPAPAGGLMPPEVATALMLAGLMIQITAKLALWRSFGIVPANRGIKASGPYRLLRHPMYAGYMVTHVGFLLGFPSLHNALVYGAAIVMQVGRLLREESLLSRDPAYRVYAGQVKYRLIPGLY
jgi:protein-S-isoprenylcysteine O-methyltransferase Ste14